MKKEKKTIFKVQSNVEGYTHYVLNNLIDIKGRSISDVISYIIKSWIDQNSNTLKESDISVKNWRESKSNNKEM